MPALDRFIALMFEKQGTALIVENDKPVLVEIQGTPRPLTKDPVAGPKVMALIKEIMPAGMHGQFEHEDGRLAFGYILDGKRVDAETTRVSADGSIHARIGPARARRSTAAVSRPAEALTMSPPPAAPAAPARRVSAAHQSIEVASQAEERLQGLLRHLVTSGSSDLHMRVALPPTYRQHGEMERHGDVPLNREDIESMLMSIMPDRNKAEYAETNDTDFAYEMVDVARFRVNALKDRMGMGAVFRIIPMEIVTFEKLGLSEHVQKLCYLTKGLVVVTGPTGSGKSTTLA